MEESKTAEERLRMLERTVEALKKTEENYRDLLENAPTPIYEIDYKIPRFKTVNEAGCRLSGYTKEELLSLNPFKLLDPESGERFRERLMRGAAGKRIDDNIEYKVITKDGRDLWAVLYVKPLYKDGKLDSAVAFAYDVTERKKAEEALRENEARLELAQRVARLGSWEFYVKEDKAVWSKEMFYIFDL